MYGRKLSLSDFDRVYRIDGVSQSWQLFVELPIHVANDDRIFLFSKLISCLSNSKGKLINQSKCGVNTDLVFTENSFATLFFELF